MIEDYYFAVKINHSQLGHAGIKTAWVTLIQTILRIFIMKQALITWLHTYFST